MRIYHQDRLTPTALTRRTYGPIHRFDHQDGSPSTIRSVIYAAEELPTAVAEVFYDEGQPGDEVLVCPQWQVASLAPAAPVQLTDLRGDGAMAIGALPSLSIGNVSLSLTQAWARQIYTDLGTDGIIYPGAHNLASCVVLWERSPSLQIVPLAGAPELPVLSTRIRARFQAAVWRFGRVIRQVTNVDCSICRTHAAIVLAGP